MDPDQLKHLLKQAAQMGAALALQNAKREAEAKRWVPKEEAMGMLFCSYTTLRRLVKRGKIRQSNGPNSRGRKYYSVEDIEKYLQG